MQRGHESQQRERSPRLACIRLQRPRADAAGFHIAGDAFHEGGIQRRLELLAPSCLKAKGFDDLCKAGFHNLHFSDNKNFSTLRLKRTGSSIIRKWP